MSSKDVGHEKIPTHFKEGKFDMNQDILIMQHEIERSKKMLFKLPQDKSNCNSCQRIKFYFLFLDGYKFWVDGNLELWYFINVF